MMPAQPMSSFLMVQTEFFFEFPVMAKHLYDTSDDALHRLHHALPRAFCLRALRSRQ
jgi:hypothetical protein